jgi:hypothetical protein
MRVKSSKLWLGAIVAAAALAALFTAPASAAPAAQAAGPVYIYTALLPNRQLDANPATGHQDGGTVYQWRCNDSLQQRRRTFS